MAITRATNLAGLGTVFDGQELRLGSSVDTGTVNQLLQVTGGAYVSDYVAIGITLLSSTRHVLQGVGTSDALYNPNSTNAGFPLVYFRNNDLTAGTDATIRLDANGSGTAAATTISAISESSGGNSSLAFATRSSGGTIIEKVRVTSTGKVGIGTSVPDSATLLSLYKHDPTSYTLNSSGNTLTLYNGSNGGYCGIRLLSEPSTAGNSGESSINSFAPSSGDSILTFSTRKSASLIERVRITQDGRVGIGTSVPLDTFHSQGIIRIDRGLAAQDQAYLRFFRQGAERARFGLVSSDDGIFINGTNNDTVNHLVINSSGNIGLGTGTPTSFYGSGKSLTIFGEGISSTLSLQAWGAVNNRDTQIELLASGNGASVNTIVFGDTDATPFTPSPLIINAYSSGVSTERVRIASSGRIGINTNIHTYANAITRVAILGFNGTAANNAGIQEVALGIAGSMRVGSALNTSTFAQPYFTNGGVDIMVGSGNRGLNVWNDDTLQYPFFTVERTGRVGIGSTGIDGHWLKVVGDESDPAAAFIRKRVDSAAIIQCVNRSGSVVFQPNCDGNVSIPIGNLVIGTAGKGIDFSQDANNAGMDSELLDDYEQGTFTIGISGPGGPSVTSQLCRYVKVGNLVTVNISTLTRQGTASGTQTITNLPFAARNTSGYTSIGIGYWSNANINIITLLCRVTQNSTNLSVWRSTAAVATLTQWQGADWQSASDTTWDFTLTYLTD